MRLLLETHSFIWWDHAPEKLSPLALAACRDSGNTLHLSLGSIWEMQIKMQLGKIRLPLPLAELIAKHQQINRLIVEPLALPDVLALSDLPPHHRDPFDRILVAQTRLGGFRLLPRDPEIRKYDVETLW